MYDRTNIMRQAWKDYARVQIPGHRFDRKLFADVLRFIWAEAKRRAVNDAAKAERMKTETVALSAAPQSPEPAAKQAMEARLDALKYLPFRYSLTAAEAAIRAEYARA